MVTEENLVNIQIEDLILSDLPSFKKIIKGLSDRYVKPKVIPGMSHDQIMFEAGQYSVVEILQTTLRRAEDRKNTSAVIPKG